MEPEPPLAEVSVDFCAFVPFAAPVYEPEHSEWALIPNEILKQRDLLMKHSHQFLIECHHSGVVSPGSALLDRIIDSATLYHKLLEKGDPPPPVGVFSWRIHPTLVAATEPYGIRVKSLFDEICLTRRVIAHAYSLRNNPRDFCKAAFIFRTLSDGQFVASLCLTLAEISAASTCSARYPSSLPYNQEGAASV